MTTALRTVLFSILFLSGCQSTYKTQLPYTLSESKQTQNNRIEELASGEMTFEHVVIKSVDGVKVPGYLFTPLENKGGATPSIIYLHGGEHGTFTSMYMKYVTLFINRKWNVLAIDYRGSAGYTEAYYNLADYGGMEIDDVIAARDWLVAQGHAPADKVAVVGGSHGGYNALMAIARSENSFAAGVDLFGPTDILYRVTSTPEENPNASNDDADRFAKMVGVHVTQNEQAYRDRSPRYLADQITAPVLIIHGTEDYVVDIQESRWLVDAFIAAGKTNFEYRWIEGGHHGYPAELFHPQRAYAVEFLARYLE